MSANLIPRGLPLMFAAAVSAGCAAAGVVVPGARELEFSSDGRFVCAWACDLGQERVLPGRWAVVDEQGRLVPEAVDEQGVLRREYWSLFPGLSKRLAFRDFAAGAASWWVSDDMKTGCRLFGVTSANPVPGVELPDSVVELWDMGPPRRRRWQVPLPENLRPYELEAGGLAVIHGSPCVVLAPFGIEAFVLSAHDGRLLFTLPYKVMPEGATRDFFASYVSFDPKRAYLAWGDLRSRYVRVLTVEASPKMVFENYKVPPRTGFGGSWRVTAIRFSGDYLVAEQFFSGRAVLWPHQITDIWRVTDWKRVWSVDSGHISGATVSPDGRRIAYLWRPYGWREMGEPQIRFENLP